MNETIGTIIRAILKVGGGYLVAKGYTDDQTVEVIIGGLLALAGVIAGIIRARKSAPTA